ncbi:MAG: hypothetical protein GC137_00185 [Alphaproteobacteria bacterium]|nr:hypothetical protein [Alphaproteobacteria bacterium]
MADPVEKAVGNGFLGKVWGFTKGAVVVAGVSTAIAAATGGLSLTADAAVAAGESVKLTAGGVVNTVGQGFVHNLTGLSDGLQAILPEATPGT